MVLRFLWSWWATVPRLFHIVKTWVSVFNAPFQVFIKVWSHLFIPCRLRVKNVLYCRLTYWGQVSGRTRPGSASISWELVWEYNHCSQVVTGVFSSRTPGAWFLLKIIYCMCMGVLCACASTHQKRALDHIVSHHVCARNWAQDLRKKEKPVLLTTKPLLQPSCVFL